MSKIAVLLSIKPIYADMIFSGRKTIELRRVCPKVTKGDLALVYVSGPRMELIGGFEVNGIISDEPGAFCKKWLRCCGISKETFRGYFKGSTLAYGIRIGTTWKLAHAAELNTLRKSLKGFHPPQSFRYLCQDELQLMQSFANKVV